MRLLFALCLAACNTTIVEQVTAPLSDGGMPTPSNLGAVYLDGKSNSTAFCGLWDNVPNPPDGGVPDGGIGNYVSPLIYLQSTYMLAQAWALGDPWSTGSLDVDGYGGVHSLWWNPPQGNMDFVSADGKSFIRLPFGGEIGPPNGIFSHVAVSVEDDSYGNRWIMSYTNGILDGKTLVPPGYRRAIMAGGGPGWDDNGGSDHSNWTGWLAQKSRWETDKPVGFGGFPFTPRRELWLWTENVGFYPLQEASQYVWFYTPVGTVEWPDQSAGFDGHGAYPKTPHPCVGGVDTSGILVQSRPFTALAPFAPDYPTAGTAPVRVFPAADCVCPVGALICDAFCRADQENAHAGTGGPQLGCTEYNADGKQRCWEVYAGGPIGGTLTMQILGGTARPNHPFPTFAVVDTGRSDGKMVADRSTSQYSDGVMGVVARWGGTAGAPTYTGYMASYEYVAGPKGSSVIRLSRLDGAGKGVTLKLVAWPHTTFPNLAIEARGTTINVYAGATLATSAVDATYPTGTRRGFWFPSIPQGQMSTGESVSRATDYP